MVKCFPQFIMYLKGRILTWQKCLKYKSELVNIVCFHKTTSRWGNEEPGNSTYIIPMPRCYFTIDVQFGNNFKFWDHNICIFCKLVIITVSTVSTLTSKHIQLLCLLSRLCLSTRTNQPAAISTNTPQCLLPPSSTMRYYSLYILHSALGGGDQVEAACVSKGL